MGLSLKNAGVSVWKIDIFLQFGVPIMLKYQIWCRVHKIARFRDIGNTVFLLELHKLKSIHRSI